MRSCVTYMVFTVSPTCVRFELHKRTCYINEPLNYINEPLNYINEPLPRPAFVSNYMNGISSKTRP